mgnify:CR=1 FL=1
MASRDPFRDWLRSTNVRDVAISLAVSTQAVAVWRDGGGVSPKSFGKVKRLAAKHGVKLTTDDLLPRAAK